MDHFCRGRHGLTSVCRFVAPLLFATFLCFAHEPPQLGCLAVSAATLGFSGPHGGQGVDGRLVSEVDTFLQRLAGFGYSGSCLVAKDGKVLLQKGYGFANRREHILCSAETVFDIGSLAKQFTAAAILLLESRGKLRVSDPIEKYLPHLPPDKKSITLHQLLTHTSGVQSDFDLYEVLSEKAALKRILALPLSSPPGAQWRYSNGGYVLLASVVEAASGMSFQDFLRDNLFAPAGMNHTGFWGAKAPAIGTKLFAHGYDACREVSDPRSLAADTWYDLGGGEVVSNVLDLHRWMEVLTKGSLLPPRSRERMFMPVMPGKPTNAYSSSDYGYGWFIQTTLNGRRRIQHGGDSVGFGCQLTWFPDEKLLLICLCNTRQDLFPIRIRADRIVPHILFHETYTMPPAFEPSSPTLRRKVVGRYRLATGGSFVIDDNASLEIGADGQDAVDVLDVVDSAKQQLRHEANEHARRVLGAVFRGELTPLKQASGGNPSFAKAVKDEIEILGKGKGKLRTLTTLGTGSAGIPSDSLATLVRLEFEKGSALYQLKWKGQNLLETSDQPCSFPVIVPLQSAARENTLVGWRIREQKMLNVEIVMDRGTITALRLRNDGVTEARRE